MDKNYSADKSVMDPDYKPKVSNACDNSETVSAAYRRGGSSTEAAAQQLLHSARACAAMHHVHCGAVVL